MILSDYCLRPNCHLHYNIKFTCTSEFNITIFDYDFDLLIRDDMKNFQRDILKLNIDLFDEIYELLGFVLVSYNNHYTGLIINNNNITEKNVLYYSYDGKKNNGKITKKTGELKNIIYDNNIYIAIYHKVRF